MIATNPRELYGQDVTGTNGDKLGQVEEIYLDNDTGRPEWAAVKTGMFGKKTSLIPLAAATNDSGVLVVPFDKERVKNAPHHDPGYELSPGDEDELYSYYGMAYGAGQTGQTGQTVGNDVSGPNTDDAMTRSEEQLRVGKTTRESGRVRLRKYVVTEQVQTTVPVSHEEVRVEREPISEANVGRATSGPAISEEEHEVVLHEEQPVVDKQVVPKERVRLDRETVVEEVPVSAEVRKEQIDTEGRA